MTSNMIMGDLMITEVVCPKCGAINGVKQKFCGECGNSFLDPTPVTSLANRQFETTSQSTYNTSSFSFSGCVTSFFITLGVAVTLGSAGIFVLGFVLANIFNLSPQGIFICTAISYIAIFGVVWWAIYEQLQQRNDAARGQTVKSRAEEITEERTNASQKDVIGGIHQNDTASDVQSKTVKVYKRYIHSENQTPIVEAQDGDGHSKLIIGSAADEVTSIRCPWCEQKYEIAISGGNVMFNCIKCKKNVFVSRD